MVSPEDLGDEVLVNRLDECKNVLLGESSAVAV